MPGGSGIWRTEETPISHILSFAGFRDPVEIEILGRPHAANY